MHSFNNMTRRHFFAAGSHAVGWAALTSLLGERGTARADEPAPRTHFAPKGATLSICTWSAGRRRWTCTTTSR